MRFAVTGANPATASATTDQSGTASFQYPGAAKLGGDTITAYADVNNNNTRDANEPQAQSTVSVVRVQAQTSIVPDLEGLTLAAATTALTAAKLVRGTVHSLPDPPRPATFKPILTPPFVVDQAPAAGAVVTLQSAVNLTMQRDWIDNR